MQPVILTANQNAVKTKSEFWHETDKNITAELRTAWDDDNFYIGIVVNKPKFCQKEAAVSNMWKGDSIQIGFDPMKNAPENSGKYGDDDFEYSVGLLRGENIVYRHHASSATYDSLQKYLGKVGQDEVKTSIKAANGRTVYELAFARRAISPFRLIKGQSMCWNVIVNLNNGEGRMGWLELTPGIGQKPKRPDQFMPVVLTD